MTVSTTLRAPPARLCTSTWPDTSIVLFCFALDSCGSLSTKSTLKLLHLSSTRLAATMIRAVAAVASCHHLWHPVAQALLEVLLLPPSLALAEPAAALSATSALALSAALLAASA